MTDLFDRTKSSRLVWGTGLLTSWLVVASALYGQVNTQIVMRPPQRTMLEAGCAANQLQLRFRTGNDDLRGGQNNLNVEIHFADGSMQTVNNVNHGAAWGNNSTNEVIVPLNRPVSPSQIQSIHLIHLAQGVYHGPNAWDVGTLATPAGPAIATIKAAQNAQTEDNWDMEEFQARAVISSGSSVPVGSFGFNRFTGSAPDLSVKAPANVSCPSANAVSRLVLTFSTGNDDLRGGSDNLNVAIHFADGSNQFEPNINGSRRWADGSTHDVKIPLNQSVTLDQIKSITISDTFGGGSGGDNWNMNSVLIDAWGSTSRRVAEAGFHRFSADSSGPNSRDLTIAIK